MTDAARSAQSCRWWMASRRCRSMPRRCNGVIRNYVLSLVGSLHRSTEQIGRFARQPVEQVARFPEAARVRLGAEDNNGHLRAALRQPQQRRQTVARVADESGLPTEHVDVAFHHELVRTVNRDRALAD